MLATTLVKELLDLPGIAVAGVSLEPGVLRVEVRLTARKLWCPLCDYSTWSRHDVRPVDSTWRHLDFGASRVVLHARLRRLRCPDHGVLTEWAPFARYRARFTADFEDVAAFLATRTDKSAIARFLRIDWDTVGRIIERVVATELDPDRLEDLVTIGVDEISWRKYHKYLTLVSNHATGKIVWGSTTGRDQQSLDEFFHELGPENTGRIQAASMDMGRSYLKSMKANAPRAVICIDPFHAVKHVGKAFDLVRRIQWQRLRTIDPERAKTFKGSRWILLRDPDNLTDEQAATLRRFRRAGATLWRAYQLKEAFRAIFHGDLEPGQALDLIDTWCQKAKDSAMPAFAKAANAIRTHRDGIAQALERRINNGRHEGINSTVRLIIRRARGFHTAQAALALVILTCGPITIQLPHEKHTR